MQIPNWMDVEFLKQVKAQERELGEQFSEVLPYHYFEVAQLLLHECQDEFAHFKQVKSLIEDLFELRKEKIMRIMKKIDP